MAGTKLDFSYDLTEYRETPKGPLKFKLKVTVCNKLDRAVKGRLVENPWKKSGSKIWILKYGYGHDAESAIGNGQEVELAPKGDKNHKDCVTKEWIFTSRPDVAYTDLYEYDERGKLKKDYLDGWVETLKSKKVAWIPPQRTQYVAMTFPVPYQMSLDPIASSAIRVAVTRVGGLPPGFSVAGLFPGGESPMPLQHGDRQSCGALVLRQTQPLEPGARHIVRLVQTIVSPASLRRWPARVVALRIEGGARPAAKRRRARVRQR